MSTSDSDQIDARTAAALARLTANEKECLRRRLIPQTAKEMAIDLSISPHAVEKRLKMARAKLGVSTSLQAARLLAASERGVRTPVPQPSDLSDAAALGDATPRGSRWRRRWIATGVLSMSLATIAAALLLTQAPTLVPVTPGAPDRRPASSPEEIHAFLAQSFALMDRDHSGFMEAAEAPRVAVRDGAPGSNAPLVPVEQPRGSAIWLAHNDRDGDGKVSLAEYEAMMAPLIAASGIPRKWKPKG